MWLVALEIVEAGLADHERATIELEPDGAWAPAVAETAGAGAWVGDLVLANAAE